MPFYVMERIKGIILRKNLPKGLTLSPADARALCERLIDVHRELPRSITRRWAWAISKARGLREATGGGMERRCRARTPTRPISRR